MPPTVVSKGSVELGEDDASVFSTPAPQSSWGSFFFGSFCSCSQEDDGESRTDEPYVTVATSDERQPGIEATTKAGRTVSDPKKVAAKRDNMSAPLERQSSTSSSVSSAASEESFNPGRRRNSVGDFMAVHRAGKALIKAVRTGDEPDATAFDRGVHVETVYDFYDPETRKVRVRKMDESVVHKRRSSIRGLAAEAANQSFSESESGSVTGGSRPGSPYISEASDGGSIISGGSSGSGGSAGSEYTKRIEAMKMLRKQRSVVDTEATANWGHLIGKVLHRKVLDFQAVKDKAIRKRRFEGEVNAADAGRSGTPIWLSRLQERAKAVAAQAVELAKKCARESPDVMDSEWDDPNLLTTLFSTEYLDTLMLLANAACKLFATQPPLVAASPPCRVFGDLHGQLRDLLLFFHAYGMPGREDENTTYVFNGDFVDRGRHQLEVIGLLLALKVMMPDKVWLIRGNHEDRLMNEKYGFKSECFRLLGNDFGRKMFDLMQSAFDRLPIACLVANRVLVVHGGIGDGLWGLSDLWGVARPLTSEKILAPENSWLFNILWSDPIEDGAKADPNVFGVHASPRGGVTAQFAWNVTKTFCARNGLGLVIRSHQSKKGSRGFDVMHSNMLVRVFSARDYEGHGNDSAVLLITQKNTKDFPQDSSFLEGMQAASVPTGDILVVRPQVLRSVMKQRAEAERRQAGGSSKRRASTRKSAAPKLT